MESGGILSKFEWVHNSHNERGIFCPVVKGFKGKIENCIVQNFECIIVYFSFENMVIDFNTGMYHIFKYSKCIIKLFNILNV